jgi:DNA-binding transcriptional LysR family regulator
VGNTQQIERSLEQGAIDLGLIEGPSHASHLKTMLWRDDELVVIAGRKHSMTRQKSVSADMLVSADWIMREPGSGTREVFEAALAERINNINISLELGHTEAIKKAVEAGLGISCLSRLAVQRELENGWLVEIRTPLDLKRTLTILLRKDSCRTRLLQSFLDMLQVDAKRGVSEPANGLEFGIFLFAGPAEKIELIEPVVLDLERAGHETGAADQKGAFRLPAIAQASGAKTIIGLFRRNF